MLRSKWRTSKGSFTTKYKANVDITIPEYSNSKVFSIEPDVVEVEGTLPTYDLILGMPTLQKLGVILDFPGQMITIDSTTLPMHDVSPAKY